MCTGRQGDLGSGEAGDRCALHPRASVTPLTTAGAVRPLQMSSGGERVGEETGRRQNVYSGSELTERAFREPAADISVARRATNGNVRKDARGRSRPPPPQTEIGVPCCKVKECECVVGRSHLLSWSKRPLLGSGGRLSDGCSCNTTEYSPQRLVPLGVHSLFVAV